MIHSLLADGLDPPSTDEAICQLRSESSHSPPGSETPSLAIRAPARGHPGHPVSTRSGAPGAARKWGCWPRTGRLDPPSPASRPLVESLPVVFILRLAKRGRRHAPGVQSTRHYDLPPGLGRIETTHSSTRHVTCRHQPREWYSKPKLLCTQLPDGAENCSPLPGHPRLPSVAPKPGRHAEPDWGPVQTARAKEGRLLGPILLADEQTGGASNPRSQGNLDPLPAPETYHPSLPRQRCR
jgi:hypothetical protein